MIINNKSALLLYEEKYTYTVNKKETSTKGWKIKVFQKDRLSLMLRVCILEFVSFSFVLLRGCLGVFGWLEFFFNSRNVVCF